MFVRIARGFLIAFFLFLISIPSFGQKKKKIVKPVADTVALVQKFFAGNMPRGNDTVPTLLELDNQPNQEEGTFNLVETFKDPGGRSTPFTTVGNWTVQTNSVNDEDAAVLVLNGEGEEFQLFFERKNDSTLLKLNATFNELEPVSMYTLRKTSRKPVIKDSLTEYDQNMMRLAGTFKGKLPCGDCKGIVSTLTLHFRKHAKSGDYVLNNRYTGTKSGDITNDSKGRWSYTSKQIQADRKSLIIVLDCDKRGRETYYLVTREGLVQLDKEMHRIEAPGDRTLRRQ